MKSVVVVVVVATSLLGQVADTKDIRVTLVAGESWLNHLHRTLEETSMGKTGRLGPAVPVSAGDISGRQRGLSADFPAQNVTLQGSDLYRLNCRGCHGESGLGAPPEINSVINPTRATSVAVTMERMRRLGMNISRANAAELAKQSRTALLQRVHNGGADMPPFAHLNGPEVRAIVAYLNQLAGVPGAEREQAAVEESPVRIGEHIVKSTCHICHNAAGANPNSEQLLNGAIPPLSTLTTRTSLPEFVRKVSSGAPIAMGTPPLPGRGRMPVFYYLSENEAADVYLYLTLYPPYAGAVLDPAMPAPQLDQAAGNVAPFVMDTEPTKALRPSKGADVKIVALPLVVELFATLLLAGGLGFTAREFRRLSAKSQGRNVLVIGSVHAALDVTHSVPSEVRRQHAPRLNELAADDNVAVVLSNDDEKDVSHSRFHHSDCRTFESAWLARRLENEDWVA
jgi:mono/diheme cytochrome c family protein